MVVFVVWNLLKIRKGLIPCGAVGAIFQENVTTFITLPILQYRILFPEQTATSTDGYDTWWGSDKLL